MSFCSSLRPLDIEFMKRLSKVVNIVPVIAKADTLTLEERVYFKQRVGPASAPPRPPGRAHQTQPASPSSSAVPLQAAVRAGGLVPGPFFPKGHTPEPPGDLENLRPLGPPDSASGAPQSNSQSSTPSPRGQGISQHA